jgi:hypothetical protein
MKNSNNPYTQKLMVASATKLPPHKSVRNKPRALCQDCMRVWACVDLVPSKNNPPGLCPVCNASKRHNDRNSRNGISETCDCNTCMNDIARLEAGKFSDLHVQAHIVVTAWTAEGGAMITKRSKCPDCGAKFTVSPRGAHYFSCDCKLQR